MTPQERMQEIANRGLQDRLPGEKKAIFDEAVKRGLITLPNQAQTSIATQSQEGASFIDSVIDVGKDVVAGGETAAAIATGLVAEPISGFSGVKRAVETGTSEGDLRNVVEQTKQDLTFVPRTQRGQEFLQNVGEFVAPVGEFFQEAEQTLGEAAFERTGSSALAAAAATIPTAITELLGFGLAKGGLKLGAKTAVKASDATVAKAIHEAAPSAEQLKQTSRAIYKEIDDLGVTVKPESYQKLVEKIKKDLISNGLDTDITPKSAKALKRLEESVGQELSLSDIDTLRKVARSAAGSLEKSDATLGNSIISSLDDFLDNAGSNSLKGNVENIGPRYKAARDLWGRARRSELLDEALEKAKDQASGFENGIRIQFRQIANNKKLSKFFTKEELAEMQKVVRGTKGANLFRLFGKLGFTDLQTSNVVGGALGASAGGVAFGTPGAVAVPVIGVLSKKLAERATKNNARFANELIRAGRDARKIAKAYLNNTPKAQRRADELAEILTRPDIELAKLPDSPLFNAAAKLASERRVALLSAAAAGSAVNQQDQSSLN